MAAMAPGVAGGRQQVDMIAHEHVGMDRAAMAQTRVVQYVQVTSSIVVVEEARHAIVATLHDVLRNVGDVGTRQASHA